MNLPEFAIKEWAVFKGAPVTFVVLLILGIASGIMIGAWHYSGLISTKDALIAEKDLQIGRYRIAIGIDKGSGGVLVDLSNEEMKAKAATTSSNLQNACIENRNEFESLQRTLKSLSAADQQKQAPLRIKALLTSQSDVFDRTLRADAINVDNELRRRLGSQALQSIPGLPPTFYLAGSNAPIGILGLSSSGGRGMSADFICALADSIEQTANLLPSK